MQNIDDLTAFSVHVGSCQACRGAIIRAGKAGRLPRYSPRNMAAEGSGVDEMGRLERFEEEVKRIGRELREARRQFDTFKLENRVKQRRLMVRIVAASSEPLTPADIHQELVRDGFPFLSKDPVHQEASVYQACRDLEELGEFKRAKGRKLSYQVAPGQVGKQKAWERFVAVWWETYRSNPVRVAELLELALRVDRRLVEGKDEHCRRIHLGMTLGKMRAEVFGQLQVRHIPSGKHYQLWFLQRRHSPKK